MMSPDWPSLREVAFGQAGCFSVDQARQAGFSPQLLSKHVGGQLERPLRGVYRLAHLPASSDEEFVVAWLWSNREAVISHESALRFYDLSDTLPNRIHLTMPTSTSRRRIPPLYRPHHATVDPRDRSWIGPVPVTTPARSVIDVANLNGDPDIVEQAIHDGIYRRLFRARDVAVAFVYLSTPPALPRRQGDL